MNIVVFRDTLLQQLGRRHNQTCSGPPTFIVPPPPPQYIRPRSARQFDSSHGTATLIFEETWTRYVIEGDLRQLDTRGDHDKKMIFDRSLTMTKNERFTSTECSLLIKVVGLPR